VNPEKGFLFGVSVRRVRYREMLKCFCVVTVVALIMYVNDIKMCCVQVIYVRLMHGDAFGLSKQHRVGCLCLSELKGSSLYARCLSL
jgi:hypothetical protein